MKSDCPAGKCSRGSRISRIFLSLQITYTLVRNGAGLGINIAGGKGSTPYRDNDEVSGIRAYIQDIEATDVACLDSLLDYASFTGWISGSSSKCIRQH